MGHRVRVWGLLIVLIWPWAMLACDGEDAGGPGETWTDPDTLLTWQVEPPHDSFTSWKQAVAYCEGLRLDGQGDWRLPSISELRTLLTGCEETIVGGECIVSDDCAEDACQTAACYSCRFGEGPSDGCYSRSDLAEHCEHYWSSTRVPDNTDRAWAIGFAGGFIYKPRIYYVFHARCVR